MPDFTTGEFTRVLGGVVNELNTLADGLGHCNQDLEMEKTPGKKVICQLPVFGGTDCRLGAMKEALEGEPRVSDLLEAVVAMSKWAADIQASLAGRDPSEPLFDQPREST